MQTALQTKPHRTIAANDNFNPLEAEFERFHANNPHVYELFKRFTAEAILAGMKHYSAAAVFHRIRWHTEVETRGDDVFKINQNHCPYYGRLFMKDHPTFEGFFRTRVVEGDRTCVN